MKGRNPYLIQLRNQYLVKRYYYWYDLERKRRDDVLEILSQHEVFLDVDYINFVMRQNNHLLKELRAAKVSAGKLDKFVFTSMPVSACVQQELFSNAAVA
ncbi:MAG TPA: hypothetical protein PKC39_14625 [Ferruginibacter sp.]|nr:hypothetical protein [Ferruginibacter sp.]HMP22191.1 hypothetical protein [Ferruginibacter sp.]